MKLPTLLVLCLAVVFLLFSASPLHSQYISKSCGRCGGGVPVTSQVGQRCPHCGAIWGFESTSYQNSYQSVPSYGSATAGWDKPPSPPPPPPKPKLPRFKELALGDSFYFTNDLARAYRWMKTSPQYASNTVRSLVQSVNPETELVKVDSPRLTRLKFEEMGLGDSFHFTNDRLRSYRWVKVSQRQASNSVNCLVRPINLDTELLKVETPTTENASAFKPVSAPSAQPLASAFVPPPMTFVPPRVTIIPPVLPTITIPSLPVMPSFSPSTPWARRTGGSCCTKAGEAGKSCEHPCCVKAGAAGKVCLKCNPAGRPT